MDRQDRIYRTPVHSAEDAKILITLIILTILILIKVKKVIVIVIIIIIIIIANNNNDKTAKSPLCRMYGTRNENISHIKSECGKLAQKEYKRGHDSVERYVHWQFCEKLGFNRARLWYEQEPESVIENENFKILWDFTIQCDHVIEAREPDIVVADKVKKENNYRLGNTRRYKSM